MAYGSRDDAGRHDDLRRLDKVLAELRVGPKEVGNITLTPSQADLGFCARKVYYKLIGEACTDRMTLQARLRMEVGNCIHDIVQEWLLVKFPDSLKEFATPDRKLFGVTSHARLDMILAGLGPNDYLVEIKTVSADKYAKCIKEVPYGFEFQMLMSAAQLDMWDDPGILLLVNRDSMSVHTKWVNLTKEAWLEASTSLGGLIHDNVEPRVVPPIPDGKSSYVCNTCQYYNSCFGVKKMSRHLPRELVFVKPAPVEQGESGASEGIEGAQ